VVLWLVMAAVGEAYGLLFESSYPLTNALLFGAFACAGLEFLVINGAFTKSAPLHLLWRRCILLPPF